MIFVNVHDVVSGRIIAVPKNIVSYIAIWTGDYWMLGSVKVNDVLRGIEESFLL